MKQTHSAEEKYRAVVKGAHAILEKSTFRDSARVIFDYCREMTGAISGYVALLSPNGEENEVLFLEAGGVPCTVDPELPMPIRGLRASVYKTHRAAYDNGFMQSNWVTFLPTGHVELKNVMFAPLNIEGETVGIIGLANKPQDFTDEDAEIATVFGELAAIALVNSRQMDMLKEKSESLEKALAQVKTLRGLIPICSNCLKIRNDKGFWERVESYITDHTEAQFSHGMCPVCIRDLYPEYADQILKKKPNTDK